MNVRSDAPVCVVSANVRPDFITASTISVALAGTRVIHPFRHGSQFTSSHVAARSNCGPRGVFTWNVSYAEAGP